MHKITIRRDESITLIGRKGSGKSRLLDFLISATLPDIERTEHRYVVLDTKQTGDYDKYPKVTELRKLPKMMDENACVVYAPNKQEAKDENFHEAFLCYCYERWNVTVIIDELGSIVKGNDTPPSYKDITDRGRAKHVTIWQGNQKPVYIPHAALSEADHYFVFDLMLDTARERMSKIIGNAAKVRSVDASGGDVYSYWYYHTSMRDPIICPSIGGAKYERR